MARFVRENEWSINGSAGLDQDEDVHTTDLVSKKRHLAHWEDIEVYTAGGEDDLNIGTDKRDMQAQDSAGYVNDEDFYVNKNGQKADDGIPDSYWDNLAVEDTEDEDE